MPNLSDTWGKTLVMGFKVIYELKCDVYICFMVVRLIFTEGNLVYVHILRLTPVCIKIVI